MYFLKSVLAEQKKQTKETAVSASYLKNISRFLVESIFSSM